MHRYLAVFLLNLFSFSAMAADVAQGDVDFSGYVIDRVPRWTWQIATPDQQWNIDVADSRDDGKGNQLFSLTHKGTLPFLEGYLKEVAERGHVGMLPKIVFSSAGVPLNFTDGGPDSAHARVFVPVLNADTGEAIGRLSFVLEQGMMVAQGSTARPEDRYPGLSGAALTNSDVHSPGLTQRLLSLLAMNRGSEAAGIPVQIQASPVTPLVLSDSRVTYLAASWASQLSDFSLSWPQEKLPSRWRATLSVMVTMQ
ncbi:fimbrial protein [Citrobacter portucalensis]|uniref:F4 family fimbrial subunit n=1 Tax=Citrobacter portucalensis TaxID=1639133 RepID=UPI00226B68EE|nr:fimbrial protein [Citrobacter portucalensis]MCX8980935.1 fimbrial protein [Citrobacter portucalensis]